MTCAARRYSDQMSCAPCGVVWDVNDPEPPACGLQCLGAAERPRDADASLAPSRGVGRPFSTPAYDRLDDDFDSFDPDDLPHTMVRDYA